MTYEVQVSIPYFNGLPRDCATNVWHFNRIGSAPTEAELVTLCTTIEGFYQEVYQDENTFASWADTSVKEKVFNLADATPRAPLVERTGVISVAQEEVTILPPEVAVVLSIHGVGVSGTPLASQRGRLYLGCLGSFIVDVGSGGTSFPTVAEGFRTQVCGAANAFEAAAITAGFTWVILSRKLATTYAVVGGHVDDAFDIQRRRGQDPTIRSVWP